MKTREMPVNELSGPALDWAVAKLEGFREVMQDEHIFDGKGTVLTHYIMRKDCRAWGIKPLPYLGSIHWFRPSAQWKDAGPIIEREDILLNKTSQGQHCAQLFGTTHPTSFGETKLEAAMRAFVCSRIGDTVTVPSVLVEGGVMMASFSGKRWTIRERMWLRENYQRLGADGCAISLRRTVAAIRAQVTKMGLAQVKRLNNDPG